jgi:hypothetical protein
MTTLINDRELLFEAAARIVATPQNIPVSPSSAIGAARKIIEKVQLNPDHNPSAVASIALAASSVFAARTPNNNGDHNVEAAVDAITGLLSQLPPA